MIPLALAEVVRLCPGELRVRTGAAEITGVTIDSRLAGDGDLFVAVGGGRDFVADAFAHCKFIGYVPGAEPLFVAAGIADRLDAAVLSLEDGVEVGRFVEQCRRCASGSASSTSSPSDSRRRVKPAGPGWTAVRAEAGVSDAEVRQENRIGAACVGWIAGCIVIWSALFTIGNFLYAAGDPSRLRSALLLLAVFVVSGLVLMIDSAGCRMISS